MKNASRGLLSGGALIQSLVRIRLPISCIQPEVGFAFTARTDYMELSSHERPSPAVVLENGQPLPGPGNVLHEDIRVKGQGRYSFWHEHVYFSSSDNTDPRTNGRLYEVSHPLLFSGTGTWTLLRKFWTKSFLWVLSILSLMQFAINAKRFP